MLYVRESGMGGAASHSLQAADHINAQQHSDSVVDSIHAVESVARTIDSGASKTLVPALKSLEKIKVLKHRSLIVALEKFYGFTNTEQGLRHALTSRESVGVGFAEALFTFGSCASFSAYLTAKHQQN